MIEMERNEIFEKVRRICWDVFNDDSIELTEESSAADIELWDSLTHLNIISDIQDEFGIKLTLDEITSAKHIGELIDAVIRHL